MVIYPSAPFICAVCNKFFFIFTIACYFSVSITLVFKLQLTGKCVDSLCSISRKISTGASFFTFSCRTECRSTAPFMCNPVGRDGSATECAVSGK